MAEREAPPSPPPLDGNHSKVIRYQNDFAWKGVPIEPYKVTTEFWKGMTRRELVGHRGESPQFHLRYFEIAAGGYSSLEQHHHEHVVVVIRGSGEVQFGCYIHRVGFGDIVYVEPDQPHQFRCLEEAAEPFGFLCIVNATRDAPRAVDGGGVCYICE